MMKRLIFAVAMVVTSAAAAGETLSVRAGEHGEYSRLVIPKAPADWRIATSDRKVEITFADKDYGFELSDILDKRKAHRVLSARIVDTDETRSLVLSLTCDCPVRTSKSAGNSIVIDIFNETPVSLAEEELEPQAPISNAARNSTPTTPENMKAARDRMIALLAEARHQGVVQLKVDEARKDEERPATPATEPTKAAMSPELVQQAAETRTPDEHAAPLPEHAAGQHLSPPSLADGPPIELVNNGALNNEDCVDPSLFHELDPENGVMDYSSISNLRQKFELSESEEERSDIAATLALAYIHLGFFEEASAVAGPRAREGDINLAVAEALADIAMDAKTRAANALAPYRECGAFGEMIYAAAAKLDDEHVAPMQEKHLAALRPMMKQLRAPLAESLGLNAIDRNEMAIAKEFYEVARAARGKERSPALAVMESALAAQLAVKNSIEDTAPKQTAPVVTEELKEIAQTAGPMQAKALAILAEDYEKRANAAYDGLLDDIAAQSARKNSTLSEARASFTGAKALVSAGRLREGVAVLEAAAHAAPGAGEASRSLAQSFIMNGLLADDKTRLAAVSTFFYYRDFVDAKDDGDLNIAVATELAAYGANALVDEALSGAPAQWRAQSDAVRALSHFNSGDPSGALAIAKSSPSSADMSFVAIRSYERLGDREGAVGALTAAMRAGESKNEFTAAAWRANDWSLANDAFAAVPKKERDAGAASRAALAALNAGARSLPAAVRETLAGDPESLAALAHMFTPSPAVSVRAIDLLAEFTVGVRKETDFMERGLAAAGDGR